MALPNFNKYKYIMFVDASGDDGYKFKETSSDGSSYSFVVSCFVTTPADLEHNKQTLLKIKDVLCVKHDQEIKSTALKRHRNANSAYETLSCLKGFAYSLVADKRLLQKTMPDNTLEFRELSIIAKNDLSGVTHTFPFMSLHNSKLITQHDKVLIIIDNMKKREMESIKSILSIFSSNQYDLTFRDSKDKDFTLIQVADIIAGTVRTYYENCLPLSTHNRYCRACASSLKTSKINTMTKICTKKIQRKLYLPYINNKNFNIVLLFHKHPKNETSLGDHFVILPVEQLLFFMYLECLILDK